jgi:hypothetical protein
LLGFEARLAGMPRAMLAALLAAIDGLLGRGRLPQKAAAAAGEPCGGRGSNSGNSDWTEFLCPLFTARTSRLLPKRDYQGDDTEGDASAEQSPAKGWRFHLPQDNPEIERKGAQH